MQLGRARDRHNPRLLRQQPCQRNLGRGGFLLLSKSANQVQQTLIYFPVLCRETRNDVADIAFVELRIAFDFAGEEPSAKRAEWHKPDAQLLKRRNDLCFRLSPPQRILILQRRDRLDSMCPPDGLHSGFRKSKVLHLALLDKVLHSSSNIFNGNFVINPMLIEQIDDIGLQPLKRGLGNFLNVLGPAVQCARLSISRIESELGRDDDIFTERLQRFADEFFVRERPIDLSGIEKSDASFDRRPNKGDSLLLVNRRTETESQPHATESDGLYFQSTFSRFALFHSVFLFAALQMTKPGLRP